MTSIITLTTDFGTRDGFAGQMKGVILSICPSVRVVDITHDIEPFAVFEAALVLKGLVRYFPLDTLHVAVVDPGVGGPRRGIVVRAGERLYVGPDNGVFSLVMSGEDSWEVREIQNPEFCLPFPHPTFHGRDVFAPAAAYLANGKPFKTVGTLVHDPQILDFPQPQVTSDGISGEVIQLDRFGNVVSNIGQELLRKRIRAIIAGEVTIPRLSHSFVEAALGEPLALVNSFGLLEIAVNRGNASQALGLTKGARVWVRWE